MISMASNLDQLRQDVIDAAREYINNGTEERYDAMSGAVDALDEVEASDAWDSYWKKKQA